MLQYGYRPNFPPTRRTRPRNATWFDYSAIGDRPPIRWPNNARVALWICPNLLHFEYQPPEDPWVNSWSRMVPDVFSYGRQEFGPRAGFWRMLKVLDKHNVRCTAVTNPAALKLYPDVRTAAVERNFDYIGHGKFNTRFFFGMSPQEELAYHRDIVREVEDMTGVRMRGMAGPGPQCATEDTPDLLAKAGLLYYGDFFHDDQPFPVKVKSGRLISVPYTLEVNDPGYLGSAFEADQFADTAKRQFDTLYRDGAENGRVMCISLHGYLFGQAQRTRYLDQLLEYILSFPDVWQTTGGEIAEYYMANYYDKMAAHLSDKKTGKPKAGRK
jgi:allantoinase